MAYRRFRPRYEHPARAFDSSFERPQPLPGVVVDAVLRFHDEVQDQGGGRALLRLSSRRLHEPEVEAALGEHANRAARVAILWNEREDEIIRVLEAA